MTNDLLNFSVYQILLLTVIYQLTCISNIDVELYEKKFKLEKLSLKTRRIGDAFPS